MSEKINSIQRTMRVLTYICYQKQGVRVSELAKAFDMSSPAIYNYLKSLQMEGFIIKDSVSGRFRATFRVLDLASVVQGNNSLAEIAYPEMVHLSDEISATVHLAILEGTMGICVSKVENSLAVPSITRVGMSFDLYATALGKALLAYLPKDQVDVYLAKTPLEPYTPHTLIDKDALLADLETTRQRGYARDSEEHKQGLHAIGVPVMDHASNVIAAISTPLASSVSDVEVKSMVAVMKDYSKKISRTLGQTDVHPA